MKSKIIIISILIFIIEMFTLIFFSSNLKIKENILSINIYLFITTIVFFYILTFFIYKLYLKKEYKNYFFKFSITYYAILLILLLFFYSSLNNNIISFNFKKEIFDSKWLFNGKINLVPFYFLNYRTYSVAYYQIIFNVICFIPLGYFLGTIFNKYNAFKIILIFIIINFLFEVLQFIIPVYRIVDIDDIITNLFGEIIGYIIYKVRKKVIT